MATFVTDGLHASGIGGPIDEPRGMRLPVLRETRMPAVVVEVGPFDELAASASSVSDVLVRAVARWVVAPVRN
jgi:N-acetylmuramoyl-L-alanine amidase